VRLQEQVVVTVMVTHQLLLAKMESSVAASQH
jgi:hypothetical protein